MSALHTPGPWDHSNGKVFGSTGTAILTVHKHKSQTVSLANLALVSAAPELLEALQLCEGNIESLLASAHPKVYGEWLAVVRAAIAKATGAA
jgi:hypothetical protein